MFKGFREFVLRGNVVDLAVGVVIGAAFGTVVTAFVKDLLTPVMPPSRASPVSITSQKESTGASPRVETYRVKSPSKGFGSLSSL